MVSEQKDQLTSKAMEKKDELLEKADQTLQSSAASQQQPHGGQQGGSSNQANPRASEGPSVRQSRAGIRSHSHGWSFVIVEGGPQVPTERTSSDGRRRDRMKRRRPARCGHSSNRDKRCYVKRVRILNDIATLATAHHAIEDCTEKCV